MSGWSSGGIMSGSAWPYSILESVELEFEGKRFFAPRDYDANLTAIFGDYMTLPPESERLPHLCRAYWKDEEPNG